jgi:hypothetical protein
LVVRVHHVFGPFGSVIEDPVLLRVCPETSGWIAEFSEHEAD